MENPYIKVISVNLGAHSFVKLSDIELCFKEVFGFLLVELNILLILSSEL